MESKLEDGQCGFRPGRSTTDQVFTLKQIFEKSWEYGKDLLACFVDLEKAYGLQQGCVLSPLLFIVYIDWIDKHSQADECATI